MKKLFLIAMLLPITINAQYTKQEIKKFEKWKKKLELRVVNRGLELNETFVFYVDRKLNSTAAEKIANLAFGAKEENWDYVISEFENAMFLNGLDVGTYEFKEIEKGSKNNAKKSGNLIVNGRYLFEFDRAVNDYIKVSVKDVQNNFKTSATLSWKRNLGGINGGQGFSTIIIEHVVKEFIKSNR